MKKVTKLLFVFSLLVLAALGSAVVANAMGDHGGNGRPDGHGDRRLSGVVTAVTADTITMTKTHHLAPRDALTMTNPITDGHPGPHHPQLGDHHPITDSNAITHSHPLTSPAGLDGHHPVTDAKGITATIKVNSSTVFYLIECQCTGTLSDVTVGRQIHVDGARNSDGTTTALTVTVAPEGDRLGGAVTAIDGATLTLQNRRASTATIVTTNATKFFTKAGAATLADIGVGNKLMAFGSKQSDGSLVASIVLIKGKTTTTGTDTAATGTAVAVEELVDVLIADTTDQTEAAVVQSLFLPVVRR